MTGRHHDHWHSVKICWDHGLTGRCCEVTLTTCLLSLPDLCQPTQVRLIPWLIILILTLVITLNIILNLLNCSSTCKKFTVQACFPPIPISRQRYQPYHHLLLNNISLNFLSPVSLTSLLQHGTYLPSLQPRIMLVSDVCLCCILCCITCQHGVQ